MGFGALALEGLRRVGEVPVPHQLDYLTSVYLGDGAYGVEAASESYFGVDVEALTLEQAALLAGLIRAAKSASPRDQPEQALAVLQRVLAAMVQMSKVPGPRAEAAGALPLGVLASPPTTGTRYPYFVEHVKRTLLADPALGGDETERTRTLSGSGLEIRTTLDPPVQDAAERAAALLGPAAGGPAEVEGGDRRDPPGRRAPGGHGGGRDFAARQFDVATRARRQPGSTMKTFALVAALEDGRRLADAVESGDAAVSLGEAETWTVRRRPDPAGGRAGRPGGPRRHLAGADLAGVHDGRAGRPARPGLRASRRGAGDPPGRSDHPGTSPARTAPDGAADGPRGRAPRHPVPGPHLARPAGAPPAPDAVPHAGPDPDSSQPGTDPALSRNSVAPVLLSTS